MPITDKDRPDPRTGKQASPLYAEQYAEHHRKTGNTFEYKAWDIDLLIIDTLLDNYRLLDVGCATGGYLRLLKNHGHVIGIDFAEETIKKADELKDEFGLKRIVFTVSMFETYENSEPFDAIRLRGTFGAYQPWPISTGAIEKTRSLLKDGGVVIASHYSPPNIIHAAKSRLFPNSTLAISSKRFHAMWASRGFTHVFSIQAPHATIAFFRKC